jgi:hypothetical protein
MRQEIFKYLLPSRAIDSVVIYRLTAPYHNSAPDVLESRSALRAVFPTPLLRLYLGFNREVYGEIRDLFYSTVTFTIDVSRDGVMLCKYTVTGKTREETLTVLVIKAVAAYLSRNVQMGDPTTSEIKKRMTSLSGISPGLQSRTTPSISQWSGGQTLKFLETACSVIGMRKWNCTTFAVSTPSPTE